jgi:hypothetical protein
MYKGITFDFVILSEEESLSRKATTLRFAQGDTEVIVLRFLSLRLLNHPAMQISLEAFFIVQLGK